MSAESWYRSFCDGIEPRSSLAEDAIVEITKDFFVKTEIQDQADNLLKIWKEMAR